MVLPFFALMVVVVAMGAILTGLREGYLRRAQLVGSTLGSARFVSHLLRLPVSFFTQRGPAEIARRLQSHDHVADMLTGDVPDAIVNGFVVVAYAMLLWSYDPQLTLLGIAIALLNLAVLRVVMKIRESGVSALRGDLAKLYAASFNGVQLIETIKATGAETAFLRRWAGYQATVLNRSQRLGLPVATLSTIAPLLAALNSAMILFVGGLRAVDGHISIGVLVAFQTLIVTFTQPVSQADQSGRSGSGPWRRPGQAQRRGERPTGPSRRRCASQLRRIGLAAGTADTAARHLRIRPARSACDRRCVVLGGARRARRHRRRLGQRQVNNRETHLRSVRTMGGRDLLRWIGHGAGSRGRC